MRDRANGVQGRWPQCWVPVPGVRPGLFWVPHVNAQVSGHHGGVCIIIFTCQLGWKSTVFLPFLVPGAGHWWERRCLGHDQPSAGGICDTQGPRKG